MTRAPLQTANARAGGLPLEIPVDLGGEHGVVTYEFSPVLGVDMTKKLDHFRGLARSGGTIEDQFDAMMDLIDSGAVGDTIDRLKQAIADKMLGMPDVLQIGIAMIEEVSGTHPTKQASSSDGSPTTGETSTAGAPPAELTPPPLPSTD